jgi:ubiquinone/menaquinone biosynthesis C-methylase UbiE
MAFEDVVRPFEVGHRDFAAISPKLWQPLGAALVRRSSPEPGEHVLDACCGEGASAIPAALDVGPNGHVDAVDGAPALVAVGRERAGDLGQLTFASGDVTAWTSERPYDLIQCAYGVFFFPDMDADSNRLIALLRPGGRFVVSAWRHPAIRDFATCLIDMVEAETGVPLPRPNSVQPAERIDSEEKLAGWLRSLGLADVQVWTEVYEPELDPEFAWNVVTGTGFRGLLATFDEAGAERVRSGLIDRLREKKIDKLDATSVIGVGRLI